MSEDEKIPKDESGIFGRFVPKGSVWDELMLNRGSWIPSALNFYRNGGFSLPKQETDRLLALDDITLTPITIDFVKGFAPSAISKPRSPEDKYLYAKLREAADLYASSIFWNGLLPRVDPEMITATEKPAVMSAYSFYKTVYARVDPNHVAIVHISDALRLFRELRKDPDVIWIREGKGNWVVVNKTNLIPFVRVQITRFPTNGMWMIDRKKLRQQALEKLNNPHSSEGENEG